MIERTRLWSLDGTDWAMVPEDTRAGALIQYGGKTWRVVEGERLVLHPYPMHHEPALRLQRCCTRDDK